MRTLVSEVMFLCGVTALVVAGWLVTPSLGLAVAGCALLVTAVALQLVHRRTHRPEAKE